MNGERNTVIRERRQSSFRDDVFAVLQDPSGESPQEKSQGLLLGFAVRKSDHDHGNHPFEKLAELILSQAVRKQNSGLPGLGRCSPPGRLRYPAAHSVATAAGAGAGRLSRRTLRIPATSPSSTSRPPHVQPITMPKTVASGVSSCLMIQHFLKSTSG